MVRYYTPKNFIIQELVDPVTHTMYGERCLTFFDPRILITLDALRVFFGRSITVNNWKWGGEREWSGLRTPHSPYYSTFSQHSFGRAIDFVVAGMTSEYVQKKILEHTELFPYLTRMEKGTDGWTHIDCANVDVEGVYVFAP